MKMYAKSVMVEDQAKALAFYTEKLGFQVKHNIPLGEHSWIALVSSEEPDGTELVLEPNAHPAAKTFMDSIKGDGIPWTAFSVDDIDAEVAQLKEKGVTFTTDPMQAGEVKIAIFDDTCGNLIQLIQLSA